MLVGAVFIPVGIVLKGASDSVVEVKVQYDGDGSEVASCMLATPGQSRQCTVNVEVSEDMEPPVYVYYQLEDFYQNHRRYVKSRDDTQLDGTIKGSGSLSDCDPLIRSPVNNKILHPCGLIANSYFNDTFTVTSGEVMDETGIAWSSDKDKFKKVSPSAVAEYNDTHQFIEQTYPNSISSEGVEDEHFIVWMRTAALPTFRKLYGKIDSKITKGTTVSFSVNSQFNVQSFKGTKSLVLSTTSWLGGKNPFLGWAYIIVGALCVGLALVFAGKELWHGRELGDPTYLNWN